MANGWVHIWDAVEGFRAQHPCAAGDNLPVDVFTLLELDLGLDIMPFNDLRLKYGIDAALSPDFKGLYVDAESYLVWEKGPIWKQNRLRFTVAHELGHFVLHSAAAKEVKLTSFNDFARHFRDSASRGIVIEQEADEFAGRLLVLTLAGNASRRIWTRSTDDAWICGWVCLMLSVDTQAQRTPLAVGL